MNATARAAFLSSLAVEVPFLYNNGPSPGCQPGPSDKMQMQPKHCYMSVGNFVLAQGLA